MTEEERAKAKAKDNYDIEARRSHWDTDFIDWMMQPRKPA
jgi:hypothetical protein